MLGKDKLDRLVSLVEENVEEEFPEDAMLGVCMLVVEVRTKDPDATSIMSFCTDRRVWVQRGLLQEAEVGVDLNEVEVEDD